MTIFETDSLPPTQIDPLIDGREVDLIMGGQSPSTRNADPDQRALAIKMTEPGRRTKRVRWLKSEVLELRSKRIEAARANSETVRQQVTEQNERRAARRQAGITREDQADS
jgi:hypothetical protein